MKDGVRVDPAFFNMRVAEKRIGTTIQMSVMRRNRLITLSVTVGSRERTTYTIKEKMDASELQKKIFTTWLEEKKFDPE